MLQVLMSDITLTLVLNERKEMFTEIAVTVCKLEVVTLKCGEWIPNPQFSEGSGGFFW